MIQHQYNSIQFVFCTLMNLTSGIQMRVDDFAEECKDCLNLKMLIKMISNVVKPTV